MERRHGYNSKYGYTSDLCTGYGTGITCVACCYFIGAPCFQKSEKNLLPVKVDMQQDNGSTHAYCLEDICASICIADIKSIHPTFQNKLKRFNKNIEASTSAFEMQLRKGLSIKKIARGPKNFLGRIDGKIGCLLYPYENRKQGIRYRESVCARYLCPLAEETLKKDSEIAEIMKTFAAENSGRLDTLSYSKIMYHILHYQSTLKNFFGLNLQFSMRGIVTGKTYPAEWSINDLNKLLEIVTT